MNIVNSGKDTSLKSRGARPHPSQEPDKRSDGKIEDKEEIETTLRRLTNSES
jgi:hypothetical protein